MEEFKIEKGIPFQARKLPAKPALYPWEKMKVGDSLVMPNKAGITTAVSWSKTNHPAWRWTSRTEPNGNSRVWRIK